MVNGRGDDGMISVEKIGHGELPPRCSTTANLGKHFITPREKVSMIFVFVLLSQIGQLLLKNVKTLFEIVQENPQFLLEGDSDQK